MLFSVSLLPAIIIGIWDFDHKDGNRYNNSPSNCQALCPTCHAKKTRGLLKQEKKFHLSWRIVVGVILFLVFLYVGAPT